MVAEVELGGDSRAAVGRPVTECVQHMTRARSLAHRLGDRGFEAATLSRLAILAANDMDFVRALELGTEGVARGREAGDDVALAAGLDGLKTSACLPRRRRPPWLPVIDELVPLAAPAGRRQTAAVGPCGGIVRSRWPTGVGPPRPAWSRRRLR